MIVLESGEYYQVRITLHPQESHWNQEAVDSILPASAALPDGPTPLPQNQPKDPLTAVVSGEAGSWHPRHALYCLWRWAQRRWSHTKDWSAMWRFHLDGRQQLEAIPQHKRATESPATGNLCPVFAIHQIRALALHTNRIETETRAVHAALVHKVFSALRSALLRRLGNLPGANPPRAETRKHAPTNTRGDSIGTALPHPTPHMHSLPPATGHRQWKGATPAAIRSPPP